MICFPAQWTCVHHFVGIFPASHVIKSRWARSYFEASQSDYTEAVQPNRVYFRPALINIGHVLLVWLETIICIAFQCEIDPLATRDHKGQYLITAVRVNLLQAGWENFVAQYRMDPDQGDGEWESVRWEIFTPCRITSVPKRGSRDFNWKNDYVE